jgi:TolB-like protein/DNA-binding winged helix-turn-helix (wHTH) protein/tetratricopeptide (TPR) repeat protein
MVSSDEHTVHEFGGFRLDVDGRRLYAGDGAPIAISSRVFDTLACLVEHRGELVSKAVLMQAVWPDTVVEENNLNQAITALRKALGERPGDYRFIVTEPGRGYRFVADVSASFGPAAAGGSVLRRRRVGAGIAVAVVVALAIGYAGLRQYTATVDQETQPPIGENSKLAIIPHSVAVLPFENLSPDPDDAYFAAGIHDEIINRLAGISDLNVIARTSVMQYAGTARPITDIAKELRVESVMEGTVRYADQEVRITAQLVDGNTGTELWSGAYSRELTHIFSIQADIANAISTALEAELVPAERARLQRPPTDSPAAYALFLQAMKMMNDINVPESLTLLDRAVSIDPGFAQAYAYSAYQRAWQLVNAVVAMPNDPERLQEWESRVYADTDRALELDAELPVAWVSRALTDQLTWRWRDAAAAYERAYALSPNDVTVLREYAQFKVFRGDYDEAMRLARLQVELDPNDLASHRYLIGAAAFSGNPDVALEEIERARELAPGDVTSVAVLGFTLLQRGGDRHAAKEALATAEQMISGDSGLIFPSLIYAYGRYGYTDDALRVFHRFKPWAADHRVGAGDWTLVYLGMRDADTAYAWLTRAVERVSRHEADAGFWGLYLIMVNLHKDPILEQARFQALRTHLRDITRQE